MPNRLFATALRRRVEMAEEKRPVGRPTEYRPEYCEQVRKLCRLGATEVEIADFFEVTPQTIAIWKHKHPGFFESIKDGRKLADAEVADRLYKRALGYEHKAVKISSTPDGREHITEYTERYPPDTTAAIFWLKNRRPDLWRDKRESELSGPNGGPIQAGITVSFVKPQT